MRTWSVVVLLIGICAGVARAQDYRELQRQPLVGLRQFYVWVLTAEAPKFSSPNPNADEIEAVTKARMERYRELSKQAVEQLKPTGTPGRLTPPNRVMYPRLCLTHYPTQGRVHVSLLEEVRRTRDLKHVLPAYTYSVDIPTGDAATPEALAKATATFVAEYAAANPRQMAAKKP